ncbi:MAG: tRNA uridine-5-carboxymethylaminomethyl(34) synthesis GTPase MnmE [Cytophagaceae bacterium]|jgi:tRNA modification GTPase|nr:tRNA uridine-5-carboxymethylaminomethyl(34) synthesis GTPase MnmE [Cytophagaceae bacterium]
MTDHDTICAIATAPGSGAIAVIRVSGKNAFTIFDKIFVPAAKGKTVSEQAANTVRFGAVTDDAKIIDEALVTVFCAPHSFTGEDTVEIACHGSAYIQQQIIQLLIAKGCRLAQPGEFTQRAFMNGKMDLSQAEAVADLIASQTEASRRVALQQMRGGFSSELVRLREQLLWFISLIELELDFGEEDVEFADRSQLNHLVNEITAHIAKLINSFALGNAIKNGIPVAIVGHTNVGKSTLLNRLLNEERAIVSNIHGTTRDAIEDAVNIKGIMFRFIDTAGIRSTDDEIENLGIQITYSKIKQASVVLLMVDITDSDHKIREAIANILENINAERQRLLVIANKTDLDNEESLAHRLAQLQLPVPQKDIITISAKHNRNIEQLVNVLLNHVNMQALDNNETIVTNARHYEALRNALESLERVKTGLADGISGDFLAQDIREALHFIGEITGEISTDEILGNIFSKFCIGK